MELYEGLIIADRYKLICKLGGGAFSEVWKACDILLGLDSVFALKIFNIDNESSSDYEMLMNEFKLMCNLNHNNLLTPKYYEKWNEIAFLVLQYCEEGACDKMVGKFSEQQAIKFFHDVASGLKYLHNQKSPIIHQDIKPDNVLMDQGNFIITDFGVSTKTKRTAKLGDNNNAGTVSYLAPERFNKTYIPITSSDIWSLGATVFELITGKCPYGNDGGISQQNNEIPNLPKGYSKNLKKLIKICLSKEPWDRPKAEEIVDITSYYLENKTWRFPAKSKHTTKKTKKRFTLLCIIILISGIWVGAYYWGIPLIKRDISMYDKLLFECDSLINSNGDGYELLSQALKKSEDAVKYEEKYFGLFGFSANAKAKQQSISEQIDVSFESFKNTALESYDYWQDKKDKSELKIAKIYATKALFLKDDEMMKMIVNTKEE